MPLPRDGRAAIRDFPVAFEDHIRLDFGMQRALHEIAHAGHAPSGVAHGLRSGDDFAAVVGGVTEPDKSDHYLPADGNGFTRSAERTQPVVTRPPEVKSGFA